MLTTDEFYKEFSKSLKESMEYAKDDILYNNNDEMLEFIETAIFDFIDGKEYDFEYQVFLMNYYEALMNERMEIQHFTSLNQLFGETLYTLLFDFSNRFLNYDYDDIIEYLNYYIDDYE